MLISQEYRQMNTALHNNPSYGSRVRKQVYKDVMGLIVKTDAESVLDYGCGKGEMSQHVPLVVNYDPAVEAFSADPKACDIVACCDVLEHIEPELLDNVLSHIHKLARKAIYLVISTRPAGKILADGRNAHLIVKPANWWEHKIRVAFTDWGIESVDTSKPGEVTLILLGANDGSR